MLSVSFSTDSFYGWDATKDYDEFHNVYNAGDNLSWIKGAHSFKFGYGYQMIQTNRHYANNKAGSVSFSRLETAVPTDQQRKFRQFFRQLPVGRGGWRVSGDRLQPGVAVSEPLILRAG